MDDLPETKKTKSADALTELQAARRAVTEAGVVLASHHTRANKIRLRQLQAAEQKLVLRYYQDRLRLLATVTDKQKGVRNATR